MSRGPGFTIATRWAARAFDMMSEEELLWPVPLSDSALISRNIAALGRGGSFFSKPFEIPVLFHVLNLL